MFRSITTHKDVVTPCIQLSLHILVQLSFLLLIYSELAITCALSSISSSSVSAFFASAILHVIPFLLCWTGNISVFSRYKLGSKVICGGPLVRTRLQNHGSNNIQTRQLRHHGRKSVHESQSTQSGSGNSRAGHCSKPSMTRCPKSPNANWTP